jgi:hypothetical protein
MSQERCRRHSLVSTITGRFSEVILCIHLAQPRWFTYASGVFSDLNVQTCGPVFTRFAASNNAGQLEGACDVDAFIYDPNTGASQIISEWPSFALAAVGINNVGQTLIVGAAQTAGSSLVAESTRYRFEDKM